MEMKPIATPIDRKSMLLVMMGYLIWGFQPLYWSMMGHMDSLFVLACRILWGAVFTIGVLACTHRMGELWAVLKDWKKMRYLIPAAVLLLVDWAVFIVAVQTGRVLDTSVGYYMTPLVTFLLSLLLFKEKCRPLQFVAIGLAVAGVVISAFQYGRFSLISLVLAVDFAVYGAVKRYAQVESVVSIAAETLLMSPLALLFILFFRMGDNGMAAVGWTEQLLIMGSGAVTAMPMILYSRGVIRLPMLMMGFMQYLSPSLSLICGLIMGETLSPDRLVSFLFIWAALGIFSYCVVRQEKDAARNVQTR